jgi:hypothetical protein
MLIYALPLLIVATSTHIQVNIEPHGDIHTEAMSIVAIPTGKAVSDVDTIRVPLGNAPDGASKNVDLALRSGETFRISCEGKSVWCPSIESRTASALTLPVFPSGRLAGRLVAPPGHSTPTRATIQGIVSGSPRWRFRETVPLSSGVFSVPVPRVEIDVRVAVDHFVPIYRFGLAPSQTDLGFLTLAQGSSVVGHVLDRATAKAPTQADVALIPAGPLPLASRNSSVEQGRLGLQNQDTRTDKDGRFQMKNVTPGRYRLEIEARDHPRLALSLEVAPDSETNLDEVLLTPFLRLDISLDPAVDPQGHRWRVGLLSRRDEAAREQPVFANASIEGNAVFSRLEAGSYSIQVQTERGDRLLWTVESIDEDRHLRLKVPVATVSGTVRKGQTSLPLAEVTIETGIGDRTELVADDSGKFEGFIHAPANGALDVEVLEQGSSVPRIRHYDGLKIEGDRLKIDIDLGGRVAAGFVIDDEGKPALDAMVTAAGRGESFGDVVSAKTNEAGQFELTSLGNGDYRLTAQHKTLGVSAPFDLNPSSSEQTSLITLQLYPGRVVKGMIISSAGSPVPNALAIFIPEQGPPQRTKTDAAGAFEVRLPFESPLVVAQVLAPSQLLWSGCIGVPSRLDDQLTIRLPPTPGGALQLQREPPEAPSPRGKRLLVLTEDRGYLGLNELLGWRLLVTGVADASSALPGLAAGRYAVMWSSAQDSVVNRVCNSDIPASVQWRSLSQGGDLLLTYTPDSEVGAASK